jgi:multicomponent Na+:H+ antiporter subunit G
MILGVLLALLSAIGIVRMPDVYIRAQVASKAASLGVGLLMLAVAAHFMESSVIIRALLVVAFIFLTAPVSAHLIARAAYLTGIPLTPGSKPDELSGAYEEGTGKLLSRPPEPGDPGTTIDEEVRPGRPKPV